ncbi:MAG: Rpn family recombination-promoting nuclease/putative transposase [Treponema sp.]|jgi:predicted transposase/invertase (TIGR01784 family)|nr:Rpn family recombination-promoting nuclease/putative transposase [Treponema sp.]
MMKERLKPLYDFAFQKAMGEKGDEIQLIAFLNAVLRRTGKDHIESVEIFEDRDLPAETVGEKAGKLDVLAKLADNTRVNIEVQLANQYNMERRSLDYWAWNYTKGIGSGQNYSLLPVVIGINILDFGYIPLEEFHTSFHIYEDRYREYMLTDVLELHYLDMVKFRKQSEKDIVNDSLHRWLVYFDRHSPIKLIEEVLSMDAAIQEMQKKIDRIQGDPALLRSYLRYEKAASDEITRMHGARQEGKQEGKQEEKTEIARNLKRIGVAVEQIARGTGLSVEEIAKL